MTWQIFSLLRGLLIGVWKYHGDFDEKFDGIFDFAGFIQNFHSFFWAVQKYFGAINFRKLCSQWNYKEWREIIEKLKISKLNKNENDSFSFDSSWFGLFSSRFQEQGRNGVLRKIRQPMGGFVFGAEMKRRKVIG